MVVTQRSFLLNNITKEYLIKWKRKKVFSLRRFTILALIVIPVGIHFEDSLVKMIRILTSFFFFVVVQGESC